MSTRERFVALLALSAVGLGGTAARAGASSSETEPTAQVRYVPTNVAGWNAGWAVAGWALSSLAPTTVADDVRLIPTGSSMVVSLDDVGVRDGETIRVAAYQHRTKVAPLRVSACIKARTGWRVSGLEPGRLVSVTVIGVTDDFDYVRPCTGHAAGGSMSVFGARWSPTPDPSPVGPA